MIYMPDPQEYAYIDVSIMYTNAHHGTR